MNLIIVESPTKARTLGRFLGKEYTVVATMGHIFDLPKSTLGIDVEHDFKPEYVELAKKKDTAREISKAAKDAQNIFLATDPDREGEAIAWHVEEMLHSKEKTKKEQGRKYARIVFHEITESAVKHALETPRTVDMQLVDAQQARRVLDRLVGYKLSPLLWKKVRRGLSAGRVQSVAVRLVVEREREIEAFVSREFWEIEVEVSPDRIGVGEKQFMVSLVKIGEDKAVVANGEQAAKVVADLEGAAYKVLEVKKREVHKKPYAPFTTSTLAQSAASTFGWSSKRTMSIAQKLYEEGLITYHRTDSLNLAKEAVFAARDFIKGEYGGDYIPEKPRFFKTSSRVAQEAHEAIRPTDVNLKFEILNLKLDPDGAKLYGLIWRRFVACQMAEAVLDETKISIEARSMEQIANSSGHMPYATSYTLSASGQIMRFEGWRKVYGGGQKEEMGEQQLPDVLKGDALEKIKVLSEQKFTQPPPRYNEASLIKVMEKLGIGRPSTYAPTISTIQLRMYVEKVDRNFRPTVLGIAVNDFLMANFADVFDYQFTANMEGDLDSIANGEKKWVPVISEFWKPFAAKLGGVEKNAERVQVKVQETGEKCPVCGEDLKLPEDQRGRQVIRTGRFGKFLSCSRFPDCAWKAPFVETINMRCPECKTGEVVVKKTKKGRKFFGCSQYPECKWASWHKPRGVEDEGDVQEEVLEN